MSSLNTYEQNPFPLSSPIRYETAQSRYLNCFTRISFDSSNLFNATKSLSNCGTTSTSSGTVSPCNSRYYFSSVRPSSRLLVSNFLPSSSLPVIHPYMLKRITLKEGLKYWYTISTYIIKSYIDSNIGLAILFSASVILLNSFSNIWFFTHVSLDTMPSPTLSVWVKVNSQGPGSWEGGSTVYEAS